MAVERSKSCDSMKQLGILVLRMSVLMMVMTYIEQPGLVRAAAEGEQAEEALKSDLVTIEMKAHNLYPESFDWDAGHSRFLVGSVGHGKLVTVTEDGNVEDFVKDEEYAGGMILGVTVDPIRNRVLAVANRPSGPNSISGLAAYDLDSKKRTFFVNFLQEEDVEWVGDGSAKRAKNVMANDVAVDGDGNAYVTNSAGNSIWKVTPEGVQSVFIASVPQLPFAPVPRMPYALDNEFVKTVTTNGIVFDQEGHLLVSQSNSGAIWRIRLADQEMEAVKITDGASNNVAVLPAADGMTLRSDGSLVVVSTHSAWLLSSKDSWQSATLIDKVPLNASFSTTAVKVKDSDVFAIHAHFAENFGGLDRDSFKIVEIKFAADDSQDKCSRSFFFLFGVNCLVTFHSPWGFGRDKVSLHPSFGFSSDCHICK